MTAPCTPKTALTIVCEQAEDEGLWFIAQTAAESYLQAALRLLHAAVEREARKTMPLPMDPCDWPIVCPRCGISCTCNRYEWTDEVDEATGQKKIVRKTRIVLDRGEGTT